MIKQIILLISTVLLLISCKKDDQNPQPTDKELTVPSAIQVRVEQNENIAVITGKADPNTRIQLKYKSSRGGVAAVGKTDAQGDFSLSVPLFNGYVQQLVAFTEDTEAEKKSAETEVADIPVRSNGIALSTSEIKQLLEVNRWKSDQNSSRLIIKQTNPTPPYDVFVLTAQKYFEFKTLGAFYFAVTSPLQFADDKGSWTINDQNILNIQTTIPLGPMEMKNIRIQEITSSKLVLLADISDGVFIISLIKE